MDAITSHSLEVIKDFRFENIDLKLSLKIIYELTKISAGPA